MAPERIGPKIVDAYRLTPAERRAYWSGEWYGEPVTSKRLSKRKVYRADDENAAAELAARTLVMLIGGVMPLEERP